jgi:hypothetical protein
MDRRTGLVLLFAAGWLILATQSAAAEDCGPVEDAERASYRALAWTDFQGPAPDPGVRGGDRHAIAVQIHTSLRIDALAVATEPLRGGGFVARAAEPCVRGYVLKQRSARVRSAGFVWQLAHEQGHFDLTQLHAQQLAQQLAALAAEGGSAADAERALWEAVERAYQGASREHAIAQRRYDRETSHGHRHAQQLQWRTRVAARLDWR